MKLFIVAAALTFALVSGTTQFLDAPTGFDNKTNGIVDDGTHQADQMKFDEVEQPSDGLGPLYNAQSCRECHQSPVSGAASQVTELRVGHQGPDGRFRTPDIPIAHGAEVLNGRSLVNDRATCPDAAFPDKEIQERVPQTETIRTFRLSLNLLGDGFVEAIADQTLIDLSKQQCKSSRGKIGCATCHIETLTSAPAGTEINGRTFTIPSALGSLTLHPYGDFLMHDVGTGDSILQATREHYGQRVFQQMSGYLSKQDFESSRNKIRTAPLWGVRLRPRLMDEGASLTFREGITRQRGVATHVIQQLEKLKVPDQEAIIEFL